MRTNRAVTRDDVARSAGVSPRTVSNVVSGFAHVSPETRRRVQAAIDSLGYQVNPVASSLRSGRTGILGLVVPALDQPYFAELARAIVSEATAVGYTVVVDQTDGDPVRERQLFHAGQRRALFDGLILSPLALDSHDLLEADPRHCPMVLLGERTVGEAFDHVGIDNVAAAHDATVHLVARGRRRIAAIGIQEAPRGNTGQLRTRGFLEALAEADIAAAPGLMRRVEAFTRRAGFDQMTALLDADEHPDSVFCFNDVLAVGALRACLGRGVRVPEDIAIMGFDDVEEASYLTPALTSIRPDRNAIARHAVGRLLAQVERANEPRTAQDITVPHELVQREST